MSYHSLSIYTGTRKSQRETRILLDNCK